jgi:hypothetical protein
MPTVRTLSQKSSLIAIRSHIVFTLRHLESDPLTTSLAPSFQSLLDEWPTHFQTELDLNDQVDDGQIVVTAVDGRLNRFADRTSKELLTITGDSRTNVLYLHYFDKPLHLFKKPILADQLTAMQGWISSLQASEHPSLKALAPELIPLIAEADQAVRDKSKAEQALASFREIGDRKRYIDRVNALRKEMYGALATLPHKHAGLPSTFADGFFRRSKVKGEEAAEPTIASVEAEITALHADLAARQAKLKELQDRAKEADEKEAERAANKVKLADIEMELAAKQKEADALRAAIEAANAE